MSIHVLKDQKVFQLQTQNTSYQIAVDDYGYVLHVWYGDRLPVESLEDTICREDIGFSGNPYEAGLDRTISPDTLPMEYPGFGCGDFRDSAIALRFPDGSVAADFRYESYAITDGHSEPAGLPHAWGTEEEPCQTLTLRLRDAASNVRVELFYGVYEAGDVITRHVRVLNDDDREIWLERCLSCSLDFYGEGYDLLTFHGKHLMERMPQRTRVTRSRTEIYSLRGMSSHHTNPAMILCERGTDETHGACWGLCFAYSGNFRAGAQVDQRGTTRVNMGIHPDVFSWRLLPGEAFEAPQVFLAYSGEGFDALSDRYHRFIKNHVSRSEWTHARRPVLINSWEAAYFQFDREKLLDLARSAKEMGVDMMVLDDGWFGARNDDLSSLGDWTENTEKLGGTLRELSEAVHAIGLDFGLWVEPEMISENSALYRAHPDWALQMPNRKPQRSRFQLVLDMSRRDVRDYLFERLCAILDDARIEYMKWDFNRNICDLYTAVDGARQGETAHRWMLGTYELMDRITTRYPHLLLENCSGGGGRFDAGMLYFSPQIWCSDDTDAVNRAQIQYGSSFFYPTSAMASHVSVCPNHQTGRTTPMATRFDVAMTGAFGYELDATKLSQAEIEEVRAQLKDYRALESLLREGSYHRLTGTRGGHMAWEFVDPARSRALVTVLMTRAEGNENPVRVYPRGLKGEARYACPELNAVHTGLAWMKAGMLLDGRLMQYETRRLTLIEQAD